MVGSLPSEACEKSTGHLCDAELASHCPSSGSQFPHCRMRGGDWQALPFGNTLADARSHVWTYSWNLTEGRSPPPPRAPVLQSSPFPQK